MAPSSSATPSPLIDLLPYGRQEEWQDSPEGWPKSPTYSGWGSSQDVAAAYGPCVKPPAASRDLAPAQACCSLATRPAGASGTGPGRAGRASPASAPARARPAAAAMAGANPSLNAAAEV